MFLNAGYDTWPGIGNRELPESWVRKLEPNLALAFANEDDFFEANDAIAMEARRGETTGSTAEGGDSAAIAQ